MPLSLHGELKDFADGKGETINAEVRLAIRKHLKK